MEFKFKDVTYVTQPAALLTPEIGSCVGCEFFDKPIEEGCNSSQEVYKCCLPKIIWVKKND